MAQKFPSQLKKKKDGEELSPISLQDDVRFLN